MINFSDRIFKFATLGKKTSLKQKRLFFVFFIIYSMICFSFVCFQVVILFQSYSSLTKAKKLRSRITQLVENSKIIENARENNTSFYMLHFSPGEWMDVGIERPDPGDITMPERAIELQKFYIESAYFSIFFLLLFLTLPWVIIRLSFLSYNWLFTADNLIKT